MSDSSNNTPLTIGPLSPILTDKNTVILDASWLYHPDPPTRNALKEFQQRRIPGARFWSLDDVSEPLSGIYFGYKLMLPSPERFADFAGKHGILPENHVVVYDTDGVFAAPRTVFTFKVYGHEKVSLLDGGLPRAIFEGIKLEEGAPKPFETTVYPVPQLKKDVIATYEEVRNAIKSPPLNTEGAEVLLDARPSVDFIGSEEPKTGHIPYAFSLPFPTLVKSRSPNSYLSLLSSDEFIDRLKEILGQQAEEVLNKKRPVINTCGGGLSAAIIWLSLQNIGIESKLYDESWNGYSQRPESVIAKGA